MSEWFLINHLFHPWVLLLLPIPFLLLYRQIQRRHDQPTVVFSGLDVARGLPMSMRQRVSALFPYTRCLALCLGIIALARPQHGSVEYTENTLGIDISMIIDVSGSMQMQDYRPNRLEVAKDVAAEFVKNRKTDRVSVVIFGEGTALLAPPTRDMAAVEQFIRSIYPAIIRDQATAIGDGLGHGVRKLNDAGVRSKVAILLTDGEQNAGTLTPLQAADIAKALDVRVYTIGLVGASTQRRGFGMPMGPTDDINEEELREIANLTGGRYFRATNEQSLRSIYAEIDQLEKSEIEVSEFSDFDERFMLFWFPGLALIGFELLLRALWLRRIP